MVTAEGKFIWFISLFGTRLAIAVTNSHRN